MDDSFSRLTRLTPEQRLRLAERVRAEQLGPAAAPGAARPPVSRAQAHGPHPATYTQEQLWFLGKLTAEVPDYNVPFRFDLDGQLDARHLLTALRTVVRRHGALRTELLEGPDGLCQVVRPEVPVDLPVRDLSGHDDPSAAAQARCFELARTVFDLRTAPLWRFELLRLDERGERHVLVWIASHSIADGGAVGVLLGETAAVYGALVGGREAGLPDPGAQLADYARWQRAALTRQETERLTAYWRRRLDGYEGLRLSYDRPGTPGQVPAGHTIRFTVPAGLREEVLALARRLAGSPFMVLLAAYQVLLARLSARTDVAVALPLACRDEPAFENVVGSLTNTVALRTSVGRDDSFVTVVGRVKDAVLGAMEHQSLPFGKLVEELRPVRRGRTNPIVETIFSYGGTPATRSWTPFGDTLRAACRGMSNDTVRFDFELVLDETLEGLVARFEYDRDRIDARSAQQICDAYLGVLRAVTGSPQAPLAELSDEGPGRPGWPLPDWSGTPMGPKDVPVPAEAGTPRTGEERGVARVWERVMGRAEVGRDADFFSLGGHSMLAVRVMAAVNEEFGTDLSVLQLFETSTVASLAAAVAAARGAGRCDTGVPQKPAGGREAADPLAEDELLAVVERMSDDEVEQALESLRDTT
ncbi:condensation domain-containing protein [Streptomyces sp. QH1-20]|uniref:condensation domain-containing protein n=1 Tax=Streptomyces sp. QH1-20 TaxID=3240934 RepID=UPI00351184A7